MVAPEEGDVEESRHGDVVHVTPPSGKEARVLSTHH